MPRALSLSVVGAFAGWAVGFAALATIDCALAASSSCSADCFLRRCQCWKDSWDSALEFAIAAEAACCSSTDSDCQVSQTFE